MLALQKLSVKQVKGQKRRARLTHAPQLPATAGQHDGCLPQANGSKRRGGYNLRLPVHPRPPPKTSLRLIQHPAPLFFTSKYDFFSPSEMDGGSDGVSFVRKGRGEDRGQRCGGREEIGGGAGRGEGNNITHVLAGLPTSRTSKYLSDSFVLRRFGACLHFQRGLSVRCSLFESNTDFRWGFFCLFCVCNYCLMYLTAMQGCFDLPVMWMRHLESLLGVYGIACLS
ncbi:hypothetical protein PO909_003043 [Leuciscus waleckii]